MVGEEIDPAGQTVGGLEDGFQGGGLEELELGPGEAQEVLQVGRQLVAGEAGEMVANHDALPEGLMDGHGKAVAKLCLADEQKAETIVRVHLVVGEQA